MLRAKLFSSIGHPVELAAVFAVSRRAGTMFVAREAIEREIGIRLSRARFSRALRRVEVELPILATPSTANQMRRRGFRELGSRDTTTGRAADEAVHPRPQETTDRKSTRLNSSHSQISYAVFCLKKKKNRDTRC